MGSYLSAILYAAEGPPASHYYPATHVACPQAIKVAGELIPRPEMCELKMRCMLAHTNLQQ